MAINASLVPKERYNRVENGDCTSITKLTRFIQDTIKKWIAAGL